VFILSERGFFIIGKSARIDALILWEVAHSIFSNERKNFSSDSAMYSDFSLPTVLCTVIFLFRQKDFFFRQNDFFLRQSCRCLAGRNLRFKKKIFGPRGETLVDSRTLFLHYFTSEFPFLRMNFSFDRRFFSLDRRFFSLDRRILLSGKMSGVS
jgi:hypothetical protein